MLSFTEEDRKILENSSPQSLMEELERRKSLLKENISDKYRSMIDKCKAIRTYNISPEIFRLREIASRILNREETLNENSRALSKAEKIMAQLSLLLKIIRALMEKDEDVYEKMKKLKFAREGKEHFRQHNFYRQIEKLYKDRLRSLSKQVEFEVGNWTGYIKTKSKEISKNILEKTSSSAGCSRKSVIFNEIFSIRPLLNLSKVLVPLYVAKTFNFHVDLFSELYSTEEEVLSFALCFLFLKKKGFTKNEFDYGQLNVRMAKIVKKLFEMTGDECYEVEEEEKVLSTKFLREKEDLLGSGVEKYVEACKDAGHYEEQAEIIDSHLCRKLANLERELDQVLENSPGISEDYGPGKGDTVEGVEQIRRDLEYMKKENPGFDAHDWNAEILVEKFTERIQKNVFLIKKKAVCKIFEGDSFSLEIIRELHGVETKVAEMLSILISDKYREKMTGDAKMRRRISGDALVVLKYYRDNGIPAKALEDLVL